MHLLSGILGIRYAGGKDALKNQNKRPRMTVKRLLVANLLALLLLIFVLITALFATGLLGSVLAFIF